MSMPISDRDFKESMSTVVAGSSATFSAASFSCKERHEWCYHRVDVITHLTRWPHVFPAHFKDSPPFSGCCPFAQDIRDSPSGVPANTWCIQYSCLFLPFARALFSGQGILQKVMEEPLNFPEWPEIVMFSSLIQYMFADGVFLTFTPNYSKVQHALHLLRTSPRIRPFPSASFLTLLFVSSRNTNEQ